MYILQSLVQNVLNFIYLAAYDVNTKTKCENTAYQTKINEGNFRVNLDAKESAGHFRLFDTISIVNFNHIV